MAGDGSLTDSSSEETVVMVKKRFSKPIRVNINAFFSLLLMKKRKKISRVGVGRWIGYCYVRHLDE
jgi:hypothetical protein